MNISKVPTIHVGIIMDGNGRWATSRGLPRVAGHRKGADALRRTIEVAPRVGIHGITFYAFSSDNWKRPADEVSALMRLFAQYLETQVDECVNEDVRISFIGRRDRLPKTIVAMMQTAEHRTRDGKTLHVRIAIDYSARDALVEAARTAPATATRETIASLMPAPDVDLLIRTGGEQRLSDFLLWECAYAELVFLPVMWPDFQATHLEQAMMVFRSRERRFGNAPAA
ncbi:MAG TPA: polyprenyl diphosphate synthase [Bryobacteraceae bacterium]|nr:polyprenyl diphosphate synthase [Bryobacteraceae bacterium]